MLIATETGCVSYHAKPLSPAAVSKSLAIPKMARLRIQAEHIEHPILKPVKIEAGKGLTPDQAAILAVLVNPKLRAERDKKKVSAAQLYQAGILPNPQFSGSLDFPVAGSTQGTVTAYGLSLGYDIRTLVTRGASIKAARLHGSSVALTVAWQEWQVAEAAKLHTYRLYLLEKQLSVAKQEEKGLRENRDAIKQAVAFHAMTMIDLAAAQAALEKVHLAVLNIEQKLEQERFALRNAIGFAPERPIRLRQGIALPKMAAIPPRQDLLKGISDRRLDLIALKRGYQSQEERLRAAVLGQFPKISTGFSQARDTGNVVSRGFAITIGLPFFDRNQGHIAIESATRKRLFDEYTDRLYQARSDIAKLRANMESIADQIQATQAYLPTQKQLVSTYYEALLEGNADVLTYYNARDQLIASHIALLNLQIQLIDQYIALEIASGEYLWQAPEQEVAQ